MIKDSTLFLESVFTKIALYDNPTNFALAVIFNNEGVLRKELRVDEFSNKDSLRLFLVNIFHALEKLWKLGMVYNNPEIPNEDISRNLIDHEFLWGYVSANIGDTNTF